MVPEALNYFGIFFGVAVGSLTVVGAGKKKWRKLKDWRKRRRRRGGNRSVEEGGQEERQGGERLELDMGEEADEWALGLDERLRGIT